MGGQAIDNEKGNEDLDEFFFESQKRFSLIRDMFVDGIKKTQEGLRTSGEHGLIELLNGILHSLDGDYRTEEMVRNLVNSLSAFNAMEETAWNSRELISMPRAHQSTEWISKDEVVESIEAAFSKFQESTISKRAKGPTIKTQERYRVFNRLKDENPTWSKKKVALEAMNELDEYLNEDTVRNAYRAMGEPWERADRIR